MSNTSNKRTELVNISLDATKKVGGDVAAIIFDGNKVNQRTMYF